MERPVPQAETACALCGRREYEVVSQKDRRGHPLRTVMCTACGLVWTNPRPTAADVDRYYASSYRIDYARQRVPSRRKILRGLLGAEERRRAFASLLGPDVRVLDVGCGAGEFVYLLRHHGVDASGIEPGAEFAEFSRRVMQIPIQTATVESATVAAGSIQLITLFHMLEHVADPCQTLSALRNWLDPDRGRLVVEVPSIDSTGQAPDHRFHYAHLYNFTGATLAALGQAAGFMVLDISHTGDGGNVTGVFAISSPQPPPPAGLPGNVARLRTVFGRHTPLRHYSSPRPYRRAFGRLARRWREDRLLSRLPTTEALLEWARRGMPGA